MDVQDMDTIPVIDISTLRDGTDPDGVAGALFAASRDPGFLYVAGHGIPDEVIDSARTEAFSFFRDATSRKSEVTISTQHRGWLAPGESRMRDDVAPDLKESFVWGSDDVSDCTHPLLGENNWPVERTAMREAANDWFGHASRVAHDLLRGFARGLALDEHFFLQNTAPALSRASFVWYPPQDVASNETRFGVGPHTDFGVLTVLCQDATGGLEVQRKDGTWIAAPPIEGTLVINVADLLSRWTHGTCRSTPHRVINRSGRERLSLVLAFDPSPDTRIDSRDVVGPDVPDQAPATTCGDYLLERFGRAFAYRTTPES